MQRHAYRQVVGTRSRRLVKAEENSLECKQRADGDNIVTYTFSLCAKLSYTQNTASKV